MKSLFSAKAVFIYGLIIAGFALGTALYLQFYQGLLPCSLCIFQRLFYLGFILTAIVALIHHPKRWGNRCYALLQLLFALGGLLVAGRQLWLQNLSVGNVPSCGPGLNYLVKNLPFQAVLKVVWAGTSDCTVVTWHFWTLSMAAWSAICFLVLAFLSCFILLKAYGSHSH